MAEFNFEWHKTILSPNGPNKPTTRLVLCCLFDFMDKHGRDCYPSMETLAKKSGLSLRSVKTHIKQARQQGWINISTRRPHGCKWRHYVYYPVIPQDASPNRELGATNAPRVPESSTITEARGAKNSTQGAKNCKDEVQQLHSNNPYNKSITNQYLNGIMKTHKKYIRPAKKAYDQPHWFASAMAKNLESKPSIEQAKLTLQHLKQIAEYHYANNSSTKALNHLKRICKHYEDYLASYRPKESTSKSTQEPQESRSQSTSSDDFESNQTQPSDVISLHNYYLANKLGMVMENRMSTYLLERIQDCIDSNAERQGLAYWDWFFKKVATTPYLLGWNERGQKITIGALIAKHEDIAKGKYDNKHEKVSAAN